MILQLNPPIPVTTPKGTAIAHAVIDDGLEHDLKWVCFLDMSGECWTFRNRYIRADRNVTQGRDYISPFYNPDDVAFKKKEPVCGGCWEHESDCCCDEYEDEDEEEDELEQKCQEFEEFKLTVAREVQERDEKIKKINELVLQSQELLLNFMRKKGFDKTDFTNMFGWLVRTGMSQSDVKTLTGMQFERF